MFIKLLPLIFAFVAFQFLAQNNTSSNPYSSYGIGEMGNLDHSAFTGIGNSAITYFDSTTLNFFNPATYNTLGDGQPLFSIGLTSRISDYSQEGRSFLQKTAFVDHFAMAFTVKKHFGFAIGLKPFARRGYDMTDRVAVGTDSLKYSYLGSGGANQVFLGLSSNLIKRKGTTLSVGANLSYLFGSSTNERRSILIAENSFKGGVDWNATRLNSFYYEIGTYFKQKFKENHTFTLAGVITPAQNINATQDYYLFYGPLGDPKYYDTLIANSGQSGSLRLPSTVSVGVNYQLHFKDGKKNNSIRNSELAVHFNYSTTDWTKFTSDFENESNLIATNKLTFGIQYTPEYEIYEKSSSSGFLEKIHYRAGYYNYTLPYAFQNEQVKDFGATFGVGIPILAQQSLSSVNFSVSAGKRETSLTGSYNEKYLGINFGITLAPASFEKWFRKRKLD